MTTLAAKQAEFIVWASLAFLSGEFAVFPELIRQIQLLLVLVPGFRLVFVLSLEPDPEVEGVGLAFLSEFGLGLLVLSDFWSGFGIVGVSRETSD